MDLTHERTAPIDRLRTLPSDLTALVSGLTDLQLAQHTPDGWTVRQIVHHLADSHMNGFIRVKLALTEDAPRIVIYQQERWSETVDSHDVPIESSLEILRGLHSRWVALLESLDAAQWARQVAHPVRGLITVDDLLILYSDHSATHLEQIKTTLAT